jgi:hypothetical protein
MGIGHGEQGKEQKLFVSHRVHRVHRDYFFVSGKAGKNDIVFLCVFCMLCEI